MRRFRQTGAHFLFYRLHRPFSILFIDPLAPIAHIPAAGISIGLTKPLQMRYYNIGYVHISRSHRHSMEMMDQMDESRVFSDKDAQTNTARLAVILNPTAGSGECPLLFEAAKAVFDENGALYDIFITEHVGHAEELAADALKAGYKTVIAAGGDGTVREIAAALCGTDAALGILPFGTGNDLASALLIPEEPKKAAELILFGKKKPTDLGRANGRVFANVCGVGFDVDVLECTKKHKKGRKGMLPYLLGIVDAIVHRRRLHAHISLDGAQETELDALVIDICNGRRFGGGMMVAPEAKQDDGLFDVCIAKYIDLFQMITLLPTFIKGKHIDKKPIIYTRAKRVRVRLEGENTVQLDGELIEKAPLECEIIAGAAGIIRP